MPGPRKTPTPSTLPGRIWKHEMLASAPFVMGLASVSREWHNARYATRAQVNICE